MVTRLVELRGLRIRGVDLGILGPRSSLVNPLTDLLDLLSGQTRFDRRHDDLLVETGYVSIKDAAGAVAGNDSGNTRPAAAQSVFAAVESKFALLGLGVVADVTAGFENRADVAVEVDGVGGCGCRTKNCRQQKSRPGPFHDSQHYSNHRSRYKESGRCYEGQPHFNGSPRPCNSRDVSNLLTTSCSWRGSAAVRVGDAFV